MSEPVRVEPRWLRLVALLRWPAVIVVLAVLGLLAIRHAADTASRAAAGAATAIAEVARGFRQETITTTFRESLPRLDPEGAGRLSVARLQVDEVVRREDETRLFWGAVSTGRTVTEVRLPVVYQFEVPLRPEAWRLEVDGSTVVVHAPAIEPGPPPSLLTDLMEVRVEEGWLRFDGEERLLEVLRELSPAVQQRAAGRTRNVLVRASARQAVEELVRGWLAAAGQWGPRRFTRVDVVFADEGRAPEAGGPRRVDPAD